MMHANIQWYCHILRFNRQHGGCFKFQITFHMIKDLPKVLKTSAKNVIEYLMSRVGVGVFNKHGLVPRCMTLQMPCLSQRQVHSFPCLLLKAQHRWAEMQPKYIETDRNYSYRCSPTMESFKERFHRASL